jgi:hypothetical protein
VKPSELERLLADKRRPQRERLAQLEAMRAELDALDDDALLSALAQIRSAIDSKSLKQARDALIGDLRRDGYGGSAPLVVAKKIRKEPRPPSPSPPPPSPPPPSPPEPPPGLHAPELDARVMAEPDAEANYQVPATGSSRAASSRTDA